MQKSSEIASAINKNAILELLRQKGPMSKADITRALKLSFPAVSYNVKKLQEENLIYEVGAAENALGRKGTLLAFNAQVSYVVGIDIGRNTIRVMCSDLGGKILAYQTRKIQRQEDVMQQVIETVHETVCQSGIAVSDVVCIGVGTPGLYDEKADCLHLAPFAETWGKGPLLQRLKQEFPVNFVIENSVNLGAIGERWQGAARGYDNIFYVDLGVGIGSAAIIDGVLMKGKNGAFGEIAYMVLGKNQLPTCFSEEGALEKLIPSRLIGDACGDSSDIQIRQVLQRMAESGEYPNIQEVPLHFAMALVNSIAVVNPDLLVIAGKLGNALYQAYEQEIQTLIQASVPFPPEITCTQLLEKASVYGAVSAALTQITQASGVASPFSHL